MSGLATIDFESRSAVNIKKHGAYRYAKDKSTKVMCLAYKLPGYKEAKLWRMAYPSLGLKQSPPPQDLFDHIKKGGLVEAHNAFFERCIWYFIMVLQHGWPEIRPEQWRCSAAKASAASLPRDLKTACFAMRLPFDKQKDEEGRKVMLKVTKPRKPRKAEIKAWKEKNGDKPMPLLWHENLDEIEKLEEYCKQDVISEEALSESIPDLSDRELAIWQLNEDRNWRGVRVDLDMARAALKMATEWKKRLNRELYEMTGIASATQRDKVKTWLKENENLELEDTRAETLEWYVEREEISDRALRVCEIVMDVNRTSTRKYQAMIDRADPIDWKIRDLLMYHGAHTGRYSGRGLQIQNFPSRDLIVKNMVEAANDIKSGDLDWCVLIYGDIMKLLSHALRGAIIPSPGKQFISADYSAVEARGTLWMSSATEALKIFERGEDIYCDMASGIYGFKVNKKDHPNERQFGKQAILGLGYGMGFVTFLLTCRGYKIRFSKQDVLRIMGEVKLRKYTRWVRNYLCLDGPPDNIGDDPEAKKKFYEKRKNAGKVIRRLRKKREEVSKIIHELALMKYTVDIYRSRYPEVKQLWADQERAAINAVLRWEDAYTAEDAENRKDEIEGPPVECGRVKWYVKGGFLLCQLPSGRCIHYRDPEVKKVKTSWGEMKTGLRYMSVDGVTKKWVRTYTYGGKIVENIVQATTRDLLVLAELRIHTEYDLWYDLVMSIHDENVCEIDRDTGSVEEFESLMIVEAPWADGFPLDAEAEILERYKK